MSRRRSDSQTINNFFTFATIVIMSIVITIYTKYIVKENPDKNLTKPQLNCQKEIYSVDKVFDNKIMDKLYLLYKRGSVQIDGGVIYSEYMPSKFKDDLNISTVDSFYLSNLTNNIELNSSRFLNIKYEIIENDKENPNKKSKESRLNSGSIITSFRLNGKEGYRIYIDFKEFNMDEIKNRVDCSMRAFINNAK